MRRLALLKMLVIFLGLFSLALIPPLALAAVLRERDMIPAFGLPLGAMLAAAVPVFFFSRKRRPRINSREGIVLVAGAWICGSIFGALPFRLSGFVPSFSRALFESVSGFTTTGATSIPDVEILPASLHLWRGMSHWLGGMGIVVLTVALMPALGVGGFQLLKAETTGPVKEKITPKVTGTAKILWLIYTGLTAVLTLLYIAGGMNFFEALIHAFSTMGTGGFSTRNGSIAAFHSPWIEWVTTVFMLAAAFNFTLFYRLFQRRFREIAVNSEARAYIVVVLAVSLAAALPLFFQAHIPAERALRLAFFDTASLISTTGFSSSNHSLWPPFAQMAVFLLLFTGGCSGSTAGGIKIVRFVILAKQMKNEIGRARYPSGLFTVRLDGKPGRKDVVYSAAGFVCLYCLMLFLGTIMGAAAGLDTFSSLNAAALTLGNIGLGMGKLVSGGVFHAAPSWALWGWSFLMIAGRLELFTVLLLFMPRFWNRQGRPHHPVRQTHTAGEPPHGGGVSCL